MSQTQSPVSPAGRSGLGLATLILALVVAAMFWRSAIPGQAMFANDAPLGVLQSHSDRFLSTFSGTWLDQNWVGTPAPGSLPNCSSLLYLLVGPLGMVKVNAAASLFLLGLGAWFALRQMGLGQAVSMLGGLAAALNSNAFSNACWGLPAWCYARALTFVALGLLAGGRRHGWLRAILAGAALGLGVADGFDSGAILSLYVAAFVMFQSVWGEDSERKRVPLAVVKVAVVALSALLVSAQVLVTLIGTQIKGVEGTGQDRESKGQRWDFATQWSLPKIEALRVIVPGLFGYRMDTPNGGAYWGTVGQQPGWNEHHQGIIRYSGSGEYAGILVVLLAAFAIMQSCRKTGSPYSGAERRMIWFWTGAAVISLLFAFGRHAPFYRLVYALPYFSTVRNPIKWMQPFHLAVGILFAFGLEAMARLYLARASARAASLRARLGGWWAGAGKVEKRWFRGVGIWFAASFLGLMIYGSSKPDVLGFLNATGLGGETGEAIFRTSLGEVWWYLLFLGLAAALMVLIACGSLAGSRARLAWICLGLLLVADLARANSPWRVYYDYRYKYASNPIIDLLRRKPYEQRVKILPFRVNDAMGMLQSIYQIEWLQHLFPYYEIQSLDITQEPRVAEDNAAYRAAFAGANLQLLLREWELTNTRLLVGLSGEFVNQLNRQIDPEKQRFRVHTPFDLVPKRADIAQPGAQDMTAVASPEGRFALIEFTAALPRARLYSRWQTVTNNQDTLRRLADLSFDPQADVLVAETTRTSPSAGATNQAGQVEFVAYQPKDIQLTAEAAAPSVLLLNDKYDPNWKVRVDGQPEPLLRCNYLMRGVELPPGRHTVEFSYEPPVTSLYLSLAAIAASLALALRLILVTRNEARTVAHGPSSNL